MPKFTKKNRSKRLTHLSGMRNGKRVRFEIPQSQPAWMAGCAKKSRKANKQRGEEKFEWFDDSIFIFHSALFADSRRIIISNRLFLLTLYLDSLFIAANISSMFSQSYGFSAPANSFYCRFIWIGAFCVDLWLNLTTPDPWLNGQLAGVESWRPDCFNWNSGSVHAIAWP